MPSIAETFRYVDRLYRDARQASRDAIDEVRVRTGCPLARTEARRYIRATFEWAEGENMIVPWTYDTWRSGSTEVVTVLRFHSRAYVFEPMLVVAMPEGPTDLLNFSGWHLEDQQRTQKAKVSDDASGLASVVCSDPKKTHLRWRAFAVSLDRLTSTKELARVVVEPAVALFEGRLADVAARLDPADPARVRLRGDRVAETSDDEEAP